MFWVNILIIEKKRYVLERCQYKAKFNFNIDYLSDWKSDCSIQLGQQTKGYPENVVVKLRIAAPLKVVVWTAASLIVELSSIDDELSMLDFRVFINQPTFKVGDGFLISIFKFILKLQQFILGFWNYHYWFDFNCKERLKYFCVWYVSILCTTCFDILWTVVHPWSFLEGPKIFSNELLT